MAAFFEFLDAGGVVLMILFGFSLLFFTIALEKWFYIRFVFSKTMADVNAPEADTPFYQANKGWQQRQAHLAMRSKLRLALFNNVSLLKVIIAIFPLLGLLGTITGMIAVFDAMQAFGTNAKAMAGGISLATIPTMAGMFLAVIALFVYSRITSVLNATVNRLEQTHA